MRSSWLISLGFLLIACGPTPSDGADGSDGDGDGDGDSSDVDGGGTTMPPPPPNEFADAAPTQACDQMDILFIIDDSGSMAQEQANLALNFPMFIEVLNTFQAENGNPIDYRVAVTSTGVTKNWTTDILGIPVMDGQTGPSGEFLQRCSMTRRWVEKTDADPAGTFACAAELGTNGPPSEMPLEAMRLAFSDRMDDGTNSAFVREDALLAVVMMTDENDCSRTDDNFTIGFAEDVCTNSSPVAPYKQFMDDITGGPGRWATAVIAGPGPGPCNSTFGDADEATRLIEFANLAGDNGIVSSICEGDLTQALTDALETFDAACDSFPPID